MKDTPSEIEQLQFEMMMKMTPQERIRLACEMFEASRQSLLNSLPNDLTEEEIKKALYYRTYGEELPEDFFG